MTLRSAFPLALAAALLLPAGAAAQGNILFPVDSLERLLRDRPFELLQREDSRFRGDRTQRVLLEFRDGPILQAKWAKSALGGAEFNNQPRYELAAYQLQKLFLDEPDLVVPPTVARSVPLAWYRQFDKDILPTFDEARSVVVVLQYWLDSVTGKDVYNRSRIDHDTAYARRWGNLNLFTYLIRHSDSNLGNLLISQDAADPRVFSVDNGVSFSNVDESDRGTRWRQLRTDRLPRATVDRLRKLRREDLDRALAVVAQFENRGGELVAVPPTAPLDRAQGVRRKAGVVQFGLTEREIDAVHGRMVALIKNVDGGKIRTF